MSRLAMTEWRANYERAERLESALAAERQTREDAERERDEGNISFESLWIERDELVAERDRYKEALREIEASDVGVGSPVWRIVRAALYPDQEGDGDGR